MRLDKDIQFITDTPAGYVSSMKFDDLMATRQITEWLLGMDETDMTLMLKNEGFKNPPTQQQLINEYQLIDKEMERRVVELLPINVVMQRIQIDNRMELTEAQKLAKEIKTHLSPYCEKIGIGGSIRRKKPVVKDLEIICIPKRVPRTNLFNEVVGSEVHPQFVSMVKKWPKRKGSASGKHTQRQLPTILLDLFMCDADNWGYIACLRTGSKEWFQRVMLPAAQDHYYTLRDGYVWYGDKKVSVPTEKAFFQLLKVPFVEPENRV